MTEECPHRPDVMTDCLKCGSRPEEDCPFADLSPELLTEAPVTAGQTGTCAVDNPECESCQ